MHFNYVDIPNGLRDIDHGRNEDINILIGENGSGKSTLLNAIARHYIFNTNAKVIAIANTIHDKFDFKNPRLEILKASTGKAIAKNTLKAALKLLAKDDNKRHNIIAEALMYVNYDPVVGIKVKGIKSDYERRLEEDSTLDSEAKQAIIYCLSRFIQERSYASSIQRINLHHSNLYDLRDSFLVMILLYEKELRSLKIIHSIDVFLYKDRIVLPINNASSGELTLITSLLYIISSISPGAIILIDEPENSLHPKWQTEYVKLLIDNFYLFEPKIIIASHSPLIINAAEITSEGVTVYKGKGGKFDSQSNDTQNVEEIYQDFFNVTTPENRYLSQAIVKRMNLLASGDLTIQDFEKDLNGFKESSYSADQQEVLDGLLEMGQKIVSNR